MPLDTRVAAVAAATAAAAVAVYCTIKSRCGRARRDPTRLSHGAVNPVRAALPSVLRTATGGEGAPTRPLLSSTPARLSVENLFTATPAGVFSLAFTEHGKAYGATQASQMTAEAVIKSDPARAGAVSFQLVDTPVEQWGINFAATIKVTAVTGAYTFVFVPGVRSYDPAGISGDSHASERIGPSCAVTQLAITIAELHALARGATVLDLDKMQDALYPIIYRYHGRVLLFEWMAQQLREAVTSPGSPVTPYPDFIRAAVGKKEINLDDDTRKHLREYLAYVDNGTPRPPRQYFNKLAVKDDLDSILSSEDRAKFDALT